MHFGVYGELSVVNVHNKSNNTDNEGIMYRSIPD